jgi:type VI protein secretion system component VasA
MNIHQAKKSTWRLIHNFQWNLLQIIDPQKCKQMAEFDDFNFDTSSDEGEFEGFTPDDVIKAIEKGA